MIYIALPRLIREANNTPVRELLRGAYGFIKDYFLHFRKG